MYGCEPEFIRARGMRVAIVGSRDYPDLEAVRQYVRRLPLDTIVISGGARGVDSVAETEARKCGLQVIVLASDWARFGRAAGMIRNQTVIDCADEVVAFWDGKSKGTKDAIDKAKKTGKPITVYSR